MRIYGKLKHGSTVRITQRRPDESHLERHMQSREVFSGTVEKIEKDKEGKIQAVGIYCNRGERLVIGAEQNEYTLEIL